MRNVVISVLLVAIFASPLIGCAKKTNVIHNPVVLPDYDSEIDAPDYHGRWIECEQDLDMCVLLCKECCGDFDGD